MSYAEARENAYFLTEKMAYELDLTPQQYDVVYSINLDYFMSLRPTSNLRGTYWRYREQDLRYVLFDWQYSLYRTLDYFLYPVRWIYGSWYYPVTVVYRTGYYYYALDTATGSHRFFTNETEFNNFVATQNYE